MEIIILGLRPFSTVEDPALRAHTTMENICVNTFKKHVENLVQLVEKKITENLPKLFCIIFDGWSAGDTHYLGVFATFAAGNKEGYERVLLTFSPMGDETSLTAEEHKAFLTFILGIYNRSWHNVVALVGDNCNTNKCISRLTNTPLVGCASHRFNLAVMDIIREHDSIISKVHALMVQLRTLTTAAKLRLLTHYKAKVSCPTRWGSYFFMMKRYFELYEFLSDVEVKAVDDHTPSASEHRQLEDVFKSLEKLQGVSLQLQKTTTTLSDVRALFEECVLDFPQLADRLSADADVVVNKTFESAVVILQNGRYDHLSSAQREAVHDLKLLSVHERTTENGSDAMLSIVERALKRRKNNSGSLVRSYIDTRFILPTSNLVESFFSRSGYAFSDRRRSLLPANFEAQMFLYANSSLWNVDDVSKIV